MITRKEEEMRLTIKIDQELLQKLYEFKTTRAIEVACDIADSLIKELEK